MGTPDESEPLQLAGSLSPMPETFRPPTPPSACVSPQEIFASRSLYDDEDDFHEFPPLSPLSTGGSTSPDYVAVAVDSPLTAKSSLTFEPSPSELSPCSRKRKCSFTEDEVLPVGNTSPSARSQSTSSISEDSDEEHGTESRGADHKPTARKRRKSGTRQICECGRDFGRSAELTRHRKTSCPVGAGAGKYQCPKCRKVLSRSDALVRHESSPGACAKHLKFLKTKPTA